MNISHDLINQFTSGFHQAAYFALYSILNAAGKFFERLVSIGCCLYKAELVDEPIRVELMTMLGLGLLPALATRGRKLQTIYFALFIFDLMY